MKIQDKFIVLVAICIFLIPLSLAAYIQLTTKYPKPTYRPGEIVRMKLNGNKAVIEGQNGQAREGYYQEFNIKYMNSFGETHYDSCWEYELEPLNAEKGSDE